MSLKKKGGKRKTAFFCSWFKVSKVEKWKTKWKAKNLDERIKKRY
jgi:hypothetical protein